MLSRTERQVSASPGYEILVVFGMRRSGNHLAINWILEQVQGTAVFYNNINPDLPPFSARMTEYRRRGGLSPRIVLSYEDVTAGRLLSPPLRTFLEGRTAQHGTVVRFALILRDPYNLFASRLRKWPDRFGDADAIAAQTALYAEHAALAAAPRPLWRDAPLVPLLYNDLVADATARARIGQALGIGTGDRGLDTVPIYGHGSSFEGTAGEVGALQARVFDRWRDMAREPAFRAALGDPRLQDAGRQLFGIEPPAPN